MKHILFFVLLSSSGFAQLTDTSKTLYRMQVYKGWMSHEQFKVKDYKVTHAKVAGWVIVSFAGFVDGVTEGLKFDGGNSFQRKFGVDPLSFWGSQSWKRAYKNNNPDLGKIPLYSLIGAPDGYHLLDDTRKGSYIGGSIIIGIGAGYSNNKLWHYLADIGVSLITSGIFKYAGVKWVRS